MVSRESNWMVPGEPDDGTERGFYRKRSRCNSVQSSDVPLILHGQQSAVLGLPVASSTGKPQVAPADPRFLHLFSISPLQRWALGVARHSYAVSSSIPLQMVRSCEFNFASRFGSIYQFLVHHSLRWQSALLRLEMRVRLFL